MTDKLLIATNNKDKITEIKKALDSAVVSVLTLNDIGINIEVEEDKDTLEGNALKKAEEIWSAARIPCSADDTGLFVDALNGDPGVYSSRYAGENVSYADNRRKLLEKMNGIPRPKRTARFRTVVCYYFGEGEYKFFEGECEGEILTEERGSGGFGYDAIFLPSGYDKTFAELNLEEKNKISHRARAFEKFKKYLTSISS